MGGWVIERPWAVVASDLMEFPQSKGQYREKRTQRIWGIGAISLGNSELPTYG